MKHFFLFLAFMFLCLPAGATILPEERMADPVLEQRAQNLYHHLRCTVCQNQSIAESSADIAADLRGLVREQLTQGKSDDEIIAYIQSRYGDYVLMKPPLKPQTWFLWFGPFLVLMAGGALAVRLMKRQEEQ